MVVEMDVRINGLSGLYNRFGFQPVDALRFENGEKFWYAGEFCVKVVKVRSGGIGFALQIRAADLALVAVFRRRGDGMRAAV